MTVADPASPVLEGLIRRIVDVLRCIYPVCDEYRGATWRDTSIETSRCCAPELDQAVSRVLGEAQHGLETFTAVLGHAWPDRTYQRFKKWAPQRECEEEEER